MFGVAFQNGHSLHAQSLPLVREVAPPSATSSRSFDNIFMVRETSGRRVIVNDGLRRQLILLDGNLTNPVVVLDSVKEGGQAYGPVAAPLIRYTGDSSLYVDMLSRTLLVLDANGKVVRAMAVPKQTDMIRMWGEASGTDQSGNMLYRAITPYSVDTATLSEGVTTRKQWQRDSVAIVRGVFQTRAVDTIARLKLDNTTRTFHTFYPNGRKTLLITINPLTPIDEWAALSDGTVAVVRGHDYHVDFFLPDGTKKSTPKLPYDWKRLTDDDKHRLVDSTRNVIEKIRSDAAATGGATEGNDAAIRYLRTQLTPTLRPAAPPASGQPKVVEATLTYEFAPLNEIADYYPPIRYGAARADEDGNLWLLPTTSAQSKNGELVYDVVSANGAPFYRVRLPVGRSVAGFGKKGVVYLMHREGDLWHLERTRVTSTVSAKH